MSVVLRGSEHQTNRFRKRRAASGGVQKLESQKLGMCESFQTGVRIKAEEQDEQALNEAEFNAFLERHGIEQLKPIRSASLRARTARRRRSL